MKVVMVEPNKPAYITEIGDDYKSIHDAVGGLIEPIYFLHERGVVGVLVVFVFCRHRFSFPQCCGPAAASVRVSDKSGSFGDVRDEGE